MTICIPTSRNPLDPHGHFVFQTNRTYWRLMHMRIPSMQPEQQTVCVSVRLLPLILPRKRKSMHTHMHIKSPECRHFDLTQSPANNEDKWSNLIFKLWIYFKKLRLFLCNLCLWVSALWLKLWLSRSVLFSFTPPLVIPSLPPWPVQRVDPAWHHHRHITSLSSQSQVNSDWVPRGPLGCDWVPDPFDSEVLSSV